MNYDWSPVYEHDVIETCDCRKCAIHTRDKWRRELARISAEIGLPPTMGPAPGELKRMIDDGRAAIAALQEISDVFGIGTLVRKRGTTLENVKNAARRSECLSRIEAYHTVTVAGDDDDDQDMEECLLNWGEEPDEYIETYKAALQSVDDHGYEHVKRKPGPTVKVEYKHIGKLKARLMAGQEPNA